MRPLVDAASGAPLKEVKKERFEAGATVKDRSEPCHVLHVLQVVAGARRDARAAGAAPSAEEEEARVAAAAFANSLRVFWPDEASAASA